MSEAEENAPLAERLRVKELEVEQLSRSNALLRIQVHALQMQVAEEKGRHIETTRRIRAELDKALEDMKS